MIDRYPAIQRHLSAFYGDLMPKATASDRRGRKPGKYEWYEIQDTTDYFMEFDKPKIVYPEIAMEPRFAMDVEGVFYSLKTVFLIPALEPYLVAILNSKLSFWYLSQVCAVLGDPRARGRLLLQETYVTRLPVRRISFATAKLEREQLVMEGKRFYQDCVKSNDWGKMLSFVGQLLPQKREGTPDTEHERSDVVHNLLAFLAEETTRLDKQKQAEIKGFLAWLEDYLGISLENLRNKTKVKDYWKADFESLFSVLE